MNFFDNIIPAFIKEMVARSFWRAILAAIIFTSVFSIIGLIIGRKNNFIKSVFAIIPGVFFVFYIWYIRESTGWLIFAILNAIGGVLTLARINLNFHSPGTIELPKEQQQAIYFNELSKIYFRQGKNDIALACCERAEALAQGNKMLLSDIYNEKANNYFELFQNNDALKYFNLALSCISPNSPNIAPLLINIAGIYNDNKNYDEAIKLLDEAEKLLHQNSQSLSNIYSNKGRIYHAKKDYDTALEFLDKAVEILKQDIMKSVNDKNKLKFAELKLADYYSNIGGIYDELGKYDNAMGCLYQALELRKKYLPDNSYYITDAYFNIIYNAYRRNNIEDIIKYKNMLIKLLPQRHIEIMQTINNKIIESDMKNLKLCFYLFHSIKKTHPESIDASELYNLLLMHKDLGSEAELVLNKENLQKKYPEYKEKLDDLQNRKKNLQQLELQDIQDIQDIQDTEEKQELRRKIQNLENYLAQFLERVDFKKHMAEMTTENIFKKIPDNFAIIEYGWFINSEPADKLANNKDNGMFCAYLLCKNKITLYFLEAEKVVLSYLNDTRKKIIDQGDKNVKLKPPPPDAELSKLYQLLIAPFEKELKSLTHLYIAPEGELFNLPFELLLDKKGKELSGKFSISYISTGRNIVRSDTPVQKYESAVIIADPKYDLTGKDTPETEDNNSSNDRDIYTDKERENLKEMRFETLPFAKAEALALVGIFKGKKIKRFQVEARKNTLSEISKGASAEIIHISTHGFYITKEEKVKFPYQKTNDRLSCCGLAFSGVNNWLKSDGKKFFKDYGDGILTARDVLSLDLPKTDLLVLSACFTALGDVKNGDGIKGLRRSFEIAGVKSIICTLWSVDDLASAILMEQFYKNLFSSKMDKLQALSNAKDYVKKLTPSQLYDYCVKNKAPKKVMDKVTKLNENSQSFPKGKVPPEVHPFKHPYYWAGYILQGNISTIKKN